MPDRSDKTEKPTAKRRREARKKGQIARTPELGQWLTVLMLSVLIGPAAKYEISAWRQIMVGCLQSISAPTPNLARRLLESGMRQAFVSVALLGAVVLLVSYAAQVAQGGFVMSAHGLKPRLDKLNLLKGLQGLFGPRTLWQGAKMLLKSSVVALLCYSAVKSVMPLIGGYMPIATILDVVHTSATSLLRNVALAALVLAGADYAIVRRRTERDMKMSKQEIKDEHKQSEGDPLVRSAIRARQLAAARNRMIADVVNADVLLVNPTHIAIALRYDPSEGAPRIVARGAGAIAARIRERAELARIPTVHDVPLARALYRSCEVGQEIPRELFAAVAQVLAFVISRRMRGSYGGEHRTPRTEADLPEVMRGHKRRLRAQ